MFATASATRVPRVRVIFGGRLQSYCFSGDTGRARARARFEWYRGRGLYPVSGASRNGAKRRPSPKPWCCGDQVVTRARVKREQKRFSRRKKNDVYVFAKMVDGDRIDFAPRVFCRGITRTIGSVRNSFGWKTKKSSCATKKKKG